MAVYNKFNSAIQYMMDGPIDMNGDTFKVMLTNSAPSATNTVKADLTEISAGNGYTAGGTTTTINTSRSGGTYKATGSDVVFTASGGTIGPFRYAVLYDDTPASAPVDPLVAWWDYGSNVTLNDTETFTVDFDATNGVFQAT
jgi:hypothetical protein